MSEHVGVTPPELQYTAGTEPRPSAKEKLSDDRFGNVLAALSTELKAGVISVMEPDISYGKNKLHTTIIRAQGADPGWIVGNNTTLQYCTETFAPIGLITREDTPGSNRYLLTQEGITIAQPLAGLLLQYSQTHTPPLYDYFGSINRPPRVKTGGDDDAEGMVPEPTAGRSPEVRYKIFYELVTAEKPLRILDLAERTGVSVGRIVSHTDRLAEKDIITAHKITYDQLLKDESFAYFRAPEVLKDGVPEQYKDNASLSRDAYELLKQHQNEFYSIKDIDKALSETMHYDPGVKRYTILSAILSDFVRQGFLERDKFAYDIRSEITLNSQQLHDLTDLVTLLDAFQNQDPTAIQQGKDARATLLANPTEFSALMRKARDASPYANKTEQATLESWITTILSEKPQASVNDITAQLQERYGKRMIPSSVGRSLRKMMKNNPDIANSMTGQIQFWSLRNASSDTTS